MLKDFIAMKYQFIVASLAIGCSLSSCGVFGKKVSYDYDFASETVTVTPSTQDLDLYLQSGDRYFGVALPGDKVFEDNDGRATIEFGDYELRRIVPLAVPGTGPADDWYCLDGDGDVVFPNGEKASSGYFVDDNLKELITSEEAIGRYLNGDTPYAWGYSDRIDDSDSPDVFVSLACFLFNPREGRK